MTSGFDGLDPCVHCGFCLQSCPTFLVTGDEADGPRGRILLMQALASGEFPPDDESLVVHLDRCLVCRGCEPVCPSGVSYAPAMEEARAILASTRPVPLLARLVLAVMKEPRVRKPLLTCARVVRSLVEPLAGRSRLRFACAMLAATREQRPAADSRTRGERAAPIAVDSPVRATVFKGCVMNDLFSHVHDATERTLRANSCQLIDTPGQQCCGALHAHSGLHADAVLLARTNVEAFSADPGLRIVVNSAGCGATLKEYPRLLAGDPLQEEAKQFANRVQDVSETLADLGPRSGAPLELRVAYDPPCHLLHAQRIADAPVQVLRSVPRLTLLDHDEAEICCGSAGIYSLVEPELSRAILKRKTDALSASEPDVVATGNPGCTMQIGAGLRAEGLRTPVVHPVEILDWSYDRAGYYS